MNNIEKVMQRISTIEQRIGRLADTDSPSASFAETLSQVQQQSTSGDSSSYDVQNMISTTANKYNIDPKLALAVASTESNFQPHAVSPAGAVGVMQLMPDTARSLGVTNPRDPKENIDGGIRYLKQMLAAFNGNVENAVAAYNAGPEAVKQYGGVPPYAETKDYVNKVLGQLR